MLKRFILLTSLALLLFSIPFASAQDVDCTALLKEANTILDEAQSALTQGNANLASSLMNAAQTIIAPCVDGAEADVVEQAVPETSVPRITRNADWQPVVQAFDGVEMVQVPPGCFMMGSTEEEINELVNLFGEDLYFNQGPQHEVCFDAPFWIDRYEVTNEQFERLGGVAASSSNFGGDQRPREMVTWLEARDYCQLRGMRLPTEAEWEYASRGPDSLQYPWGNSFVGQNVVYGGNSNRQTAPVGTREDGISWVGASDLSGNIWEWTSSIDIAYPYNADDGREDDSDETSQRILRGSGWDFFAEEIFRSAHRLPNDTDYKFINIGIRCAQNG